eukprot:COSAG02_NODE_48792_length_331_cov_0.879310_1_plen_46_part_10
MPSVTMGIRHRTRAGSWVQLRHLVLPRPGDRDARASSKSRASSRVA